MSYPVDTVSPLLPLSSFNRGLQNSEKAAHRIAQAPGVEAHAGAEQARRDCIVPAQLRCIPTRAKGFHCLLTEGLEADEE